MPSVNVNSSATSAMGTIADSGVQAASSLKAGKERPILREVLKNGNKDDNEDEILDKFSNVDNEHKSNGLSEEAKDETDISSVAIDFDEDKLLEEDNEISEEAHKNAEGPNNPETIDNADKEDQENEVLDKPHEETVDESEVPKEKTQDSEEPKMDSAEPETGSAKPKADSAEPKADSAEPNADSTEPKADSAEPKADSAEPKADPAEPKADSAKPKADSTEPKADSEVSKTDFKEPKWDPKSTDPARNKSSPVEDKCDNSNDYTKSPSTSDTEDLLDISVVKDAGEDESECAQNERNLNEEAEQAERDATSGSDEDDSASNSDKMDDDDGDKDDSTVASDKTDDKKETVSDSADVVMQESVEVTEERITVDETNTEIEAESNKENLEDNGEKGVATSEDSLSDLQHESMDIALETTIDDTAEKKGVKRTLSEESDAVVVSSKKTKTEFEENDDVKKERIRLVAQGLACLEEFLREKKVKQRKLTFQDLEQFCVQKICESIVYQSQLGDYHHQLKQYEQTIEAMRKDITQLSKQTRDLEIVNKKLLNDMKLPNPQKPLQPLKITRSVGLQVKFAVLADSTPTKRRTSTTNNQTSTPPAVQTKNQNSPAKLPRNTQNTIPLRQVKTAPKTNTPILSQVLSGRKSSTPTSTVSSLPANLKKAPEKNSVIDLTDEDDKNKANKAVVRAVPSNGPTAGRPQFNQSIRITSPQRVPITSGVTTSTPVMYVVQSTNSNVLGGPNAKTVLVNLQPSNGVLTSTTLNGQVSVLSTKQAGTVQLKTVTATKPLASKVIKMKHPAPLPVPPPIRTGSDKHLKPIPPKPVLTIRKTDTGIILQWKMPYELDLYETIASYQLYAYQETNTAPSTEMWRRVGDVKALALPMACTLTQFADRNKYYFAVRPVDIHKRIGAFSEPKEIAL